MTSPGRWTCGRDPADGWNKYRPSLWMKFLQGWRPFSASRAFSLYAAWHSVSPGRAAQAGGRAAALFCREGLAKNMVPRTICPLKMKWASPSIWFLQVAQDDAVFLFHGGVHGVAVTCAYFFVDVEAGGAEDGALSGLSPYEFPGFSASCIFMKIFMEVLATICCAPFLSASRIPA